MNRDEFFQAAMLKMAETILLRTDKEPSPEQLAQKSRSFAKALHDEMLAGLTELDIFEEISTLKSDQASRSQAAKPVLRGPPTLGKKGFEELLDAPVCPSCESPMKMRKGHTGTFWGCSRFPSCRGTRAVSEEPPF